MPVSTSPLYCFSTEANEKTPADLTGMKTAGRSSSFGGQVGQYREIQNPMILKSWVFCTRLFIYPD